MPEVLAPYHTQDPRIARTRRLLLDAFVELMQEKAFDKISISEITQRATLNRATFYAHFADKYELADEFVRTGFEKTISKYIDDNESDTKAYLTQLFKAAAEHRGSVRTECKAKAHSIDELRKFESITETEMRDMLRLRIHAFLSRTLPNKSVSDKGRIDLMASVVSSALYAAVVHYNSNKNLSERDIAGIVGSISNTLT